MKHLVLVAITFWTSSVGIAAAQCLQTEDYIHTAAWVELGGEATHFFAFGNRLLAHYDDQLVLLDATDPEDMTILGATTVPEYPRAMTSDGDYAYLTFDETPGLHVVDLLRRRP